MKKLFSYLILILSFGISCREDDFDILPAITQEGLNTFGCVIDGEVLIPKNAEAGFLGGASGLQIVYFKDSTFNSIGEYIRPPSISITSSNYHDVGGDLIYLYIPFPILQKEYQINESNGNSNFYNLPQPHVILNTYDRQDILKRYLSYYQSGQITITEFDTISTVISGYFNLRVVDAVTKTDTIEVTDGRFDINLRTVNL